MVTPHEVLTKIKRGETTFKENKLIRKTVQKELRRRKDELINELRKRIFRKKETHDGKGELYILGPSGQKFASITYEQKKGGTILLHSLWVGKEDYNSQSNHLLRRLGIGELLIDVVIDLAKQKGISNVELDCLPENLTFYLNCGFKIIKFVNRRYGGNKYIMHMNI